MPVYCFSAASAQPQLAVFLARTLPRVEEEKLKNSLRLALTRAPPELSPTGNLSGVSSVTVFRLDLLDLAGADDWENLVEHFMPGGRDALVVLRFF